ncbi:MAG: diguanylate cyclase [Candidatus Riflebacteria bacterium]|nr:diguanylate cyclase [Candidatus Riflebacteria bacterium]
MKEQNKKAANPNFYFFANLILVAVLLVNVNWQKQDWSVSLNIPLVLAILLIVNTLMLFVRGINQKHTHHYRKRFRKKSLRKALDVVRVAKDRDSELLQKVSEAVLPVTGQDYMSLIVLDGNKIQVKFETGQMPPLLAGSRYILKENKMHVVYTGELGSEALFDMAKNACTRYSSPITKISFVVIPLVLRNLEKAFIIFSSSGNKRFKASFASVKILYEMLEGIPEKQLEDCRAYKAPETSLITHRNFQEQIELELERSERYSQEMSLLSIKISGYEELSSEQKIVSRKHAAKALKTCIRRFDLGFEGEKDELFYAILTESDAAQAEGIAKRLQKVFEKLNETSAINMPEQAGLIIGSATYPADATHYPILIEKSEDARIEAAKNGHSFKDNSLTGGISESAESELSENEQKEAQPEE